MGPDRPLKVLTYHGSKRSISAADLAGYDVVITTYGTLSTEYVPHATDDQMSVSAQNGLFALNWRRVILDEGHQIRNPKSKLSRACTGLTARSRWVLTGTPIINSLKDLYSLVRFLRLSGGLEQMEVFNSVLIRPLKEGKEEASLLLQALMGTICLRRKKEMKFVDLRLPELSEYVHRFEFLPHEREKYEALQAEAKGLLHDAQAKAGTANGSKTYLHLLEVLLRLRQVCNHWKLCGDRVTSLLAALETSKIVDLTPQNRRALQDMLQLSIDSHEDCPICLDTLHDPVITACAHTFGYSCIEKVIETQHRCPMCRAEPIEVEKLVRPAVELGESAETDIDINTSSSKVEALLKILTASRQKEGSKVVIFSQWTSFLNIVEHQLQEKGWKYTRIDGKMRAGQRDAAMTALNDDPGCRIMLASLAVCSVGLNLVAANHVIMADSWWAPSIEVSASVCNSCRYQLCVTNVSPTPGPSSRPRPPPRPDQTHHGLAPRRRQIHRGPRAGHPVREAQAHDDGLPGESRQASQGREDDSAGGYREAVGVNVGETWDVPFIGRALCVVWGSYGGAVVVIWETFCV